MGRGAVQALRQPQRLPSTSRSLPDSQSGKKARPLQQLLVCRARPRSCAPARGWSTAHTSPHFHPRARDVPALPESVVGRCLLMRQGLASLPRSAVSVWAGTVPAHGAAQAADETLQARGGTVRCASPLGASWVTRRRRSSCTRRSAAITGWACRFVRFSARTTWPGGGSGGPWTVSGPSRGKSGGARSPGSIPTSR